MVFKTPTGCFGASNSIVKTLICRKIGNALISDLTRIALSTAIGESAIKISTHILKISFFFKKN